MSALSELQATSEGAAADQVHVIVGRRGPGGYAVFSHFILEGDGDVVRDGEEMRDAVRGKSVLRRVVKWLEGRSGGA